MLRFWLGWVSGSTIIMECLGKLDTEEYDDSSRRSLQPNAPVCVGCAILFLSFKVENGTFYLYAWNRLKLSVAFQESPPTPTQSSGLWFCDIMKHHKNIRETILNQGYYPSASLDAPVFCYLEKGKQNPLFLLFPPHVLKVFILQLWAACITLCLLYALR